MPTGIGKIMILDKGLSRMLEKIIEDTPPDAPNAR